MAHYDKSELKILALKESLAAKVNDYEDKIADLRIELTEQSADVQALSAENEQLKARIAELEPAEEVATDVVEGEVVQKTARAKKSA